MKKTEIQQLAQLMQEFGLAEIEVKDENGKIRLVAQPPPGQVGYSMPYPQHQPTYGGMPQMSAAQSFEKPQNNEQSQENQSNNTVDESHLIKIRSPFVGTFYEAASPGSASFVKEGQSVKKGDTLCIVEAMKLMNEIEAEQDGVIRKILIQNEEPVEYDQELFLLDPDA